MKKWSALVLCGGVALGLFALQPNPAEAIPQFKTEFDHLYVKPDSTDEQDKAFAATVKKVKCNICHVGKKKKDLNDYGKALGELLDKKADKKNKEKIQGALKQVGGQHCDPAKSDSPTYDDRIKNHELPIPQ